MRGIILRIYTESEPLIRPNRRRAKYLERIVRHWYRKRRCKLVCNTLGPNDWVLVSSKYLRVLNKAKLLIIVTRASLKDQNP